MKIFVIFFLCLNISILLSQSTLQAYVKDKESNTALVGVNVVIANSTLGASSDLNGFVIITNIPNRDQTITFSYLGYKDKTIQLNFPLDQGIPIEIFLEHDDEEGEEVIVTTTRSSRTISDNPTRVEAISGEELAEKGNMKPGDIRMLLNESTGIQTQQTSAISFNSSIRIQGLDGKYTQILKDGYPLYSGFSGGLSLLQIVPLDLQQVEVIKGSSSTLYGGGAIAGIVNLISKTPGEKRDLNFLLNATSAYGLDASAYYSEKRGSFGSSFFLSYNRGSAYDPADNGFSAIPEFERLTINPKLYYYFDEQTTFQLGFNSVIEDRLGGNMARIENKSKNPNGYFEENNTKRYSFNFGADHIMSTQSKLNLKNSFSFYDRVINIPNFTFSGEQFSSFSEASYHYNYKNSEWVFGLNLWTDEFNQAKPDTTEVLDYTYITFGTFIQNIWTLSENMSLESGLRLDYQNDYGAFLLPRSSLLIIIKQDLSIRLGGGMGYKTASVFTEDAERVQFRNVIAIDPKTSHAEKSYGLNADINYRTVFLDHFGFNMNTLLFYTRIDDPIVLNPELSGSYVFKQNNGFIDTKGLESNIKLSYDHIKLFIGFTYSDVMQHYGNRVTKFPLVAKHRLNNVLMYEKHGDFRIGLEAYYFSPQKLTNGKSGKDYWIMGLMTEKMWDDFSVFLNFENFLDTRQTKFETIYTGSIDSPIFNDIYAPIDGFVINGGIKVQF